MTPMGGRGQSGGCCLLCTESEWSIEVGQVEGETARRNQWTPDWRERLNDKMTLSAAAAQIDWSRFEGAPVKALLHQITR